MSNPFANNSELYAKYRPVYPDEVFEFISSLIQNKNNAWDCGTGNGQIAVRLKDIFNCVYATDISREQLDNAPVHPKIKYFVQSAEHTDFPNDFFDLIIVGQAIHWFEFDKFFSEVRRTLKSTGIIVIIGYGLFNSSAEIDKVVNYLYKFTGPFWDPQRKYLDEHYKTIPFPFNELQTPQLKITVRWTLEHLKGYLNTWSGVKHFIKAECYNPVDEMFPSLIDAWGEEEIQEVNFPLYIRLGKME